MIRTAGRLNGIGEYYFSQKLREIDSLNKAGKAIINLGIGSPDLPPHPEVVKVLQEEAAKPNVHAYQNYKGSPVLRKAMADWYQTWYGVTLNPETEILPLIGSKEGIMHICMTYLDAGDQALIPNPGYPTYSSAVKLAGGEAVSYELVEALNWEPDLDALEKTDLSRVKLMWVNYPHMPTGQVPSAAFYTKLIAFAKKHAILICHDNPYSFILNKTPSSLLAIPGAMEVVVELNSLSKSQNMAGWRVGMLAGAKDRIDEVIRFKSNMDSGMFLPVQLAAAKALQLGADWYESINTIYRQRRELVFDLLDQLKATYNKEQVGMFVWAKIPASFKDGFAMSDAILYGANVFLTPGGIFGSAGDNFIRISLCSPEEKLREAKTRVEAIINSTGQTNF
ncbi:aminotransferase class I/II-fold pyridoxal phosphate-dependent enzyme [Flavihumibacter sp. CACIAM 22H1]|uniref:pyridoxal phosphate-dependent aminotransferase n=1 Tax=Flavihumibacter sp. CACIAM 22H1 TaxID=1812911 RepID=UPI0007A8894E|nr:aminotransferase class I/II-fold pyridoxal phosphate-dependent enzyme [Flavihumibacter sp. CACIAM 22H1]KYP13424.1 MAG: aminotransferase [Flavihumibacter sp. CACIAM 22H1]